MDLSTEGIDQVADVRKFGVCACDVGVRHGLGHVVAELLADFVELVLNQVGLGLRAHAAFEDVDLHLRLVGGLAVGARGLLDCADLADAEPAEIFKGAAGAGLALMPFSISR